MLSLARSRYTPAAQFVFLTTNAAGLVLAAVYNAHTPDLYPHNAHHGLGWAVTWLVCAQVAVGLLTRLAAGGGGGPRGAERAAFLPVSRAAMEAHRRLDDEDDGARHLPRPFRLSDDSGQGTEPNTESLRSSRCSAPASEDDGSVEMRESRAKRFQNYDDVDDDDDDELDNTDLLALPRGGRARSLARRAAGVFSRRVWKYLVVGYDVVDRTILILGFVTLCLGIATFGRFFVSTHPRGRPWERVTPRSWMLIRRRRAARSSRVSRTGSKAAFSSGWACSRWAGGRAASASSVG